MARRSPPFLVVGYVEKPHGTRGEVYVRSLSDRADACFAEGARLRFAGPAGDVPDEALPPAQVESARRFKRGVLLKLDVLRDRTAAEAVRQRYLLRAFADAEPRAPGEYFYHELLGLAAVTTAGETLGEVVDIYEVAAAPLIELRGARGTHLVPLVHAIVREVNLEAERIVLDPPPGLLEL